MAGEIQDSTFSRALLVPEVTLGVEDTTAPAYELNATIARIKRERQRERPNVWSRDRRPHPSRIVSKQGALELRAPLQYENSLSVLEMFMGATRGVAITVTGVDINFDDVTNTIERPAGLNVFPLAYMLFVRGATNAANNGWKGPILVSSATSLEVPAGQIVNEAAGANVTLTVLALKDGVTEKSATVQWHGTQLDYRRNMLATKADKWTVDWQMDQFIAEAFDLMGRDPIKDTTIIGNSSIVAGYPKAEPYFTSAEDLKKIYVGNDALGTNELCLSQLNLAAQANRNAVKALNSGGPKDHIFGQLFAELTGEAYADAAAIAVSDAIDADETFFAFSAMTDPLGNSMCILLPACKGLGDIVPGERNSLVNFGDLRFDAHDPAKDTASDFYNAGAGPGFMLGVFYAPKV